MKTPLLRVATTADIDSIVRVIFESRAELLPFLPVVHTREENLWWVRHVLLLTHVVFVAETEGVTGVVAFKEDAGVGWIDQLYVHPSAVGQGVGTMLLRHALNLLRRPVRLYAFQENARARSFYERHGFLPVAFSDGQGNEEKRADVLYELLE